MIFGFDPVSNDSSLSVNIVFSAGAAGASSSSTAAGAAAAGPEEGAAKEMSGMFRRDWDNIVSTHGCGHGMRGSRACFAFYCPRVSLSKMCPTFRLATKSAVSSNVNCDIWSTIPLIFGFDGVAAAASVDACRLCDGEVCCFVRDDE